MLAVGSKSFLESGLAVIVHNDPIFLVLFSREKVEVLSWVSRPDWRYY